MKIIENTCGKVCPVVADLKAENALLTKQVAALRNKCAENEKRLAKIRQAAFGIVDWGIEY